MYIKKKQPEPIHYDPHLQTASSRIFNVLAKPEYTDDEENIKLNDKLQSVKKIIEESPTIDKFKDDQFIKLVQSLSKINQTSETFYQKQWLEQKN